MKVEVCLPFLRTSLDNLKNCLPDIKKLEEIAKKPPLSKDATRRVISVSIEDDRLTDYIMDDWELKKYLGRRLY